MFVVLITESAMEANPTASREANDQGERISFRSKQAAEEFADRLSGTGIRLRIQKVAPQDTRDINAYLVPNPRKCTDEPKETNGQSLTFDTTANQYGELGEAVVSGSYGISSGVKYYIRQNTNLPPEGEYKITRRRDTSIPDVIEYDGSWSPDVIIEIKRLEDWETIEAFYCEVKSGDASFERRQRKAMQSLSENFNVLKIRAKIDNLPKEYTLCIDSVENSSD